MIYQPHTVETKPKKKTSYIIYFTPLFTSRIKPSPSTLIGPWQVNIDAGVSTAEHVVPDYLDHVALGEAIATLVERRRASHNIYTVRQPADLKTVLLEGNL